MRLGPIEMTVLLSCAALLPFEGCGSAPPPAAPQAQRQRVSAEPAASHEIAGSEVKLVDPEGRWKFHLEAEQVEAASIHGPYALEPATARYEQIGRAAVLMSADRAQVDESARRVALAGNVRITSGAWELEADRAEYNLDSGEVVATGRTKWTFVELPRDRTESPVRDEGEQP